MVANTAKMDVFLGKQLCWFRKKVNWPLKTLASKLNISLQQLHRYEQGVNKIPGSLLLEAANILRIPVSSFYEGYESSRPQEEGSSHNILLVEDDIDDDFRFRKAVNDFSPGWQIYSVNDGGKALEIFRGLGNGDLRSWPKPNLIFLDLHLPHVKGLALLKDLKSRNYTKDIPVIILTSSINENEVKESYNLRASGFVRKSSSYEHFRIQLEQVFTYWTSAVLLP